MAGEIKKYYKFGDFHFDIQNLHLEHAGKAVKLPPKSLKALLILLEKRGETVTRAQLIEDIRAESFVEDANLTVTVSTLRKTLSAYERDEKFIETVPCRGYRFVADAEEKIEIIKEPIIIERHAVEQLTIEEISTHSKPKKFPRFIFLLFALLVLSVTIGAFAILPRGDKKAFYLSGNPAASEAFAKGERLLQKRLVCESIPHFREAIAKDENFASSYSGLAAALAMCSNPDNEADRAIAKALALDSNLAEARATEGFIELFVHWNWEGAENALRRAVALDPNLAKAHHWLAVSISIRGRFREAAGEMKRAIEIAPDSPLYHADLCQIYYLERNAAATLNYCHKAQELDPNFIFTPQYLREIYLLMGDEQKAWEYEAKFKLINEIPLESVKQEEEIVKREGFKAIYVGRIRNLLKEIKTNPPKTADTYFVLADSYAALGDKENALYWYEQAVGDGEKRVFTFWAAYTGVAPRNDFLHNEPRFQEVLRKMNFKAER